MIPNSIIAENEFGNVIVKATDGFYWRICPEDLDCRPIAKNSYELATLRADHDFQEDWKVEAWVAAANEAIGPLTDNQCFCLKIPAVIGGEYDVENFAKISRIELISSSGDIAEQIKDLPDGEKIKLVISK